MGSIVKFSDLKQKKIEKREELEKKAFEKFGINKQEDGSYLYLEYSYITSSYELEEFIEELPEAIDKLLEKNVIEAINEITTTQGEKLEISIIEDIDSNEEVSKFLISNKNTEEEFILMVSFEDNEENRETLTGIIAAAIYEANIEVSYVRKFNYEELKSFMKRGY